VQLDGNKEIMIDGKGDIIPSQKRGKDHDNEIDLLRLFMLKPKWYRMSQWFRLNIVKSKKMIFWVIFEEL